MDIADAWAVRYYEWSLQQAEQEFKEGFPLLSLVRGRIGFATVEYAKSLDSHDRIQLATALVKRLNTRALAIKGESLDVAESRLAGGPYNLGCPTHSRSLRMSGRLSTSPNFRTG